MSRRVRWRTTLALVIAAVMTASLAACSTTSAEPGELVVLAQRDDSANGQRQLLIDKWNFIHPDRPARVIELSGLADQAFTSLLADAQSDDSAVDVYGLDVTWTTEFADAGYIRPLDAVDTSDFVPGPLETARVGDDLYGLPYNTDAGLLYYRRDLVRPPRSWSDLVDAADVVRARTGPRPAGVYAGQLAPYEGLVVNVLEVLRSVDPDAPDLFAAGLPALQRAVDQLRSQPTEDPPVVLPSSLTDDEDASLQAFRQGQAAVLRDWPVAGRSLLAPSSEGPGTGLDVGVTQLPANGSILGGQNLAVSAHSDQPVAAQELIQFLTNTPAQIQLFDAGGVAPTRRSAYVGSARAGEEFTKQIASAVASAVPRPAGACYGAFSALFSSRVHEALVSGSPLEPDLLDQLRRALDCKPLR